MKSDSIVVIGHGKSPVGRRWGSHIDNCARVIRLWNWHWQDPEDWGTRYDYGCYELHATEMVRFFKHNIRQPSIGWIGLQTSHRLPYDGPVPEPTLLRTNPRTWERIGISLGGLGTKKRLVLTRGVQAACWALDLLQKGERAVLVGFDNVRAGVGLSPEEGFPEAYRRDPGMFPFRSYVGGTTKYGNHDYAVEGPLLTHLAKAKGVSVVHAEDCWG